MLNKGLFITFEGVDGSGKTTICSEVNKALCQLGFETDVTREPGGTIIGEQIRLILLTATDNKMSDTTEALLFAAARAQHVDERIAPNIKAGKIILCDRWLGSSLAYQGWGRSLGVDAVKMINDFGVRGLRPDIQFFIDVTPEVAAQRRETRGLSTDRIESAGDTMQQHVYEYLNYEANEEPYVIRINGNDSIKNIVEKIVKIITEIALD